MRAHDAKADGARTGRDFERPRGMKSKPPGHPRSRPSPPAGPDRERPERQRPERQHTDRQRAEHQRPERQRKGAFAPKQAKHGGPRTRVEPRPEPRPSPRPEPRIHAAPAIPPRSEVSQPKPILPKSPGHVVRPGTGRRAGELWIYGHHPAAAALANTDRKILRIVATEEALAKLNADPAIPPRTLAQIKAASRRDIDALVGEETVHQGVAVLTHPLEHELADVLQRIGAMPESCIVVLDQVTDPHNVGAILRSAAAFGAMAVVAPDRHAADESGAMAKSASGALDKIPYIKAGNLVRALELIKEHQYWLVGLDAEAPRELDQIKLDGRIALVLGAEGEGLRRLVKDTCDHVAKLTMAGDMESLNVSNAAAVALYERARQAKPKA